MDILFLVFFLGLIVLQLERIVDSLEHLHFDIREVDDEECDEEKENE